MVRFVNIIFKEFFVNEHKNLQFSIIYGEMLGPKWESKMDPKVGLWRGIFLIFMKLLHYKVLKLSWIIGPPVVARRVL